MPQKSATSRPRPEITKRYHLQSDATLSALNVRELISGPNPATGARLLSLNRTQSRVVIVLLTGHNTLRRHLHFMGLTNSPLCRRCEAKEKTSAHILCDCEVLASLRHAYLGSFLDAEDVNTLRTGLLNCLNARSRGLTFRYRASCI